MEKRLLNITEASEYLGIKKNTLYGWVCYRKIPYVKIGRLLKFDKHDIDKWIDKKKVKAGSFDISSIKGL
ncbi:MAG: helix-turn-helix domain-containing protein [Elusimicrobiota bacterium]